MLLSVCIAVSIKFCNRVIHDIVPFIATARICGSINYENSQLDVKCNGTMSVVKISVYIRLEFYGDIICHLILHFNRNKQASNYIKVNHKNKSTWRYICENFCIVHTLSINYKLIQIHEVVLFNLFKTCNSFSSVRTNLLFYL